MSIAGGYFVYILANNRNTVLYIGVTNNLERRVYEHKHRSVPGFTARYNLSKLVYYEQTPCIEAAISREKQLKSWKRDKKDDLIRTHNPGLKDLSIDARDPSG